MEPAEFLIPLDGSRLLATATVGGKAARLNQLATAGFRIPRGYCLTTAGYASFVREHDLEPVLHAELGRKPLATLRWEEMWDAALRLRSVFLSRQVPETVREALRELIDTLGGDSPLAVRSSAPREDAVGVSFAGLHESVTGVRGETALLDAVRVVWASLWSDAALLYLAELGMDPAESRMAIVIQELVEKDRSGVAFGLDPRQPRAECQVIEAVPGLCCDLVDGTVTPDRWILDKASGEVLSSQPGVRDGSASTGELLAAGDLQNLHEVLLSVERLCGWPPDIEWTGQCADFHLLQARPVTGVAEFDGDERRWYLGLRPGLRRLQELRRTVAHDRIPALIADGERFAMQDLNTVDDRGLANVIEQRAQTLAHWRAVYRDEFIPLAHGLRSLGTFYNDLVRPTDPFEFVALVRGEDLLALQRNRAIEQLAGRLRESTVLATALAQALREQPPPARESVRLAPLRSIPGGDGFLKAFDVLLAEHFDLEYAGERLCERPEALLQHVLELARNDTCATSEPSGEHTAATRRRLEQRLFEAAGPSRAAETAEILAVGRLSWRLRDDDNLLLGRVESQLLRALEAARTRLTATGRVVGDGPAKEPATSALLGALRDPTASRQVELKAEMPAASTPLENAARPRQLVGQSGSPGLATGPARHVSRPEDLGRFKRGDVLVCSAIQPNMTHLVPLACAIVERRGGMLIHGAIIARELGIPCVNGVARAIEDVRDGELLTVDGNLGIVTVGAPEFRMETGRPAAGVFGTADAAALDPRTARPRP